MGLLDDMFSASWRNQANEDRARGKSGTFSDAMANMHTRRSASDEASAVLAGFSRNLTEKLEEFQERTYEAQTDALSLVLNQQREHERTKAREQSGRAAAIREIAEIVELATRKIAEWSAKSPVKSELFHLWVRHEAAKSHLKTHRIDDVSLVRDVVRTQGELTALISRAGLEQDFTKFHAFALSTLMSLAQTVERTATLQSWEVPTTPMSDSTGRHLIVTEGLFLKYGVFNQAISQLRLKWRTLGEELRRFVDDGTARVDAEGNFYFGAEFSAYDGVQLIQNRALSDNSEASLDSRFKSGICNSIFCRMAAAAVRDDTQASFEKKLLEPTGDRYREAIVEHDEQLRLLSEQGTVEKGLRLIAERQTQFSDIHDFARRLQTQNVPPAKPEGGVGMIIMIGGTMLWLFPWFRPWFFKATFNTFLEEFFVVVALFGWSLPIIGWIIYRHERSAAGKRALVARLVSETDEMKRLAATPQNGLGELMKRFREKVEAIDA